MEILFATHNQYKLKEIRALLDDRFLIKGLNDLDFSEDIPEDFDTLEQNASQKAWHIYKRFGRNCFADDTGLEVTALDGAPGVYSARYSRIGEVTFPQMEAAAGNIRKLLMELKGCKDREAQFRTVISLVLEGTEHRFEGVVRGEITTKPAGNSGFGYDPVFRPSGYQKTFAEMDLWVKNRFSHRALAVQQLIEFLEAM